MKRFLIVMMVLAPAAAAAQSSGVAEAEQLFRDGKKLMKKGAYAEACLAFATSQKLDASLATLSSLADCREKNGELATAWTLFLEVERQTRDDDAQERLHETAHERARALESLLSYLTVSVPDESRVDGLELTRNGEAIDAGLWNRALPIDGGEYTITGHAPGHEAWSTTVHIPPEHGSVSVDVPKFKSVEALLPPPGAAPDDEEPDEDEAVRVSSPSIFTGRRKLALGIAGTGVIALGAAVVFGVQATDLQNQARTLCPSMNCGANAPAANAILDRAGSRALFCNLSLAAAAIAVSASAYFWFTGAPEADTIDDEPDDETAIAPLLSPTTAGIAVTGKF